jgi:hypothetical protein
MGGKTKGGDKGLGGLKGDFQKELERLVEIKKIEIEPEKEEEQVIQAEDNDPVMVDAEAIDYGSESGS